MKEKTCEIMIRNVPVEMRQQIKMLALKQGKTMQGLILELIENAIQGGDNE